MAVGQLQFRQQTTNTRGAAQSTAASQERVAGANRRVPRRAHRLRDGGGSDLRAALRLGAPCVALCVVDRGGWEVLPEAETKGGRKTYRMMGPHGAAAAVTSTWRTSAISSPAWSRGSAPTPTSRSVTTR